MHVDEKTKDDIAACAERLRRAILTLAAIPDPDKRFWTCPGLVPVTYLIQAASLSNASGLLPPSVECLRRGL